MGILHLGVSFWGALVDSKGNPKGETTIWGGGVLLKGPCHGKATRKPIGLSGFLQKDRWVVTEIIHTLIFRDTLPARCRRSPVARMRPFSAPLRCRRCRSGTEPCALLKIWVWVKIKPPGDRRFWPTLPLVWVPVWVRIFDPQPYVTSQQGEERFL